MLVLSNCYFRDDRVRDFDHQKFNKHIHTFEKYFKIATYSTKVPQWNRFELSLNYKFRCNKVVNVWISLVTK